MGKENLQSLIKILSEEAVSTDMDKFTIKNPVMDAYTSPSAVVSPKDEKELQNIMELANEKGLNLTLVSSTGGSNMGGRGGIKENILIDLSGWKEVTWINRRNRVCLIQPGVTYPQLLEALAPHGMTVATPLCPRSGKSVIAASTDREPNIWANRQWDIADPVASTEFIFGNGEFFRTGAGGGPGTLEEQRATGGAQKCPIGPSQTDFHRVVGGSQATMGIFTWISMRTELLPGIEKPYLLEAPSLSKLTGYVYEVQRPWLGEHSFILNNTATAWLMAKTTDKPFEPLQKSLPPFICLQNIAGFERLPEERVKYQEKDIKNIAASHNLTLQPRLSMVWARDLLNAARGNSGEDDWRNVQKGACLRLFFLTTLDKAERLAELFLGAAENNEVDKKDVGLYFQPVVQNHACHVECMVPFDPSDKKEVEIMKTLEAKVVPKLAEAGAFFSRPYGTAGDVVYAQNPLAYDMLKKVKGLFDPEGVLNQGKWGL